MSEKVGTFWSLQQGATQGLCLLQSTDMALGTVHEIIAPGVALAERAAESACTAGERDALSQSYRSMMGRIAHALAEAHASTPPLLAGKPAYGANAWEPVFVGTQMGVAWPSITVDALGLARYDLTSMGNAALALDAIKQALQGLEATRRAVQEAEVNLCARADAWSWQHIRQVRGYGAFASPDHANAAIQAVMRTVRADGRRALAAQANITPAAAAQLLVDVTGVPP